MFDKNNKAFTLIELLVVISIIGLLSSIVLVSTKGVREKARLAKAQKFDSSIQHALGSEAVGIWRFEKGSGTTAHDESGYGNDGELKGGMDDSNWVSGVYPNTYALSFDGSGDYVDTDFQPDFIHTGATLAFWGSLNNVSAASVIGCHNSHRFYLGVNNNKIGGGIQNANNWNSGASINLANKEWGYFVIVADNGIAKEYFNGTQVDTFSYTPSVSSNPISNFFIGAWSDPVPGAWWNGKIDDVRIYDTALSAMEIQQHYAEGAKKYGIAEK